MDVAVTAEESGVDVLWKTTVKFVGGFWAQSKKNPVTGWNGWEAKVTVTDWLTLERFGCHFVDAAPSTAEMGN